MPEAGKCPKCGTKLPAEPQIMATAGEARSGPPGSPSPSETSRDLAATIVWTVIHFVVWAALFFAFLLLVPPCYRVFDDFGMELPGFTILMIKIGYGIARFWYPVVLLGGFGIALDFAVLRALGRGGHGLQAAVGVLLAVVPLLIGALLFASFWLPMMKLIEGLG